MLESLDPEVRRACLVRHYYTRQGHLHGDCFHAGPCEPIEETERRIRQTTGYIDEAVRLGEGEGRPRRMHPSPSRCSSGPGWLMAFTWPTSPAVAGHECTRCRRRPHMDLVA